MKKIFVFFLLVFIGIGTLSAQKESFNASFFHVQNTWNSGHTELFWGVYTKDRLSVQTRLNFDSPNTFALYVGRKFSDKKGNHSVVLEIGGLWGSYRGFGPEAYGYGEFHPKVRYFWFLQWATPIPFAYENKSLEPNSFFYTYTQSHFVCNKNFSTGFGGQFWINSQNAQFADLGWHSMISLNSGLFIKPWITVDPLNGFRNKIILGIGKEF